MEELIHQFGIDWKLLLAQVVNFSILLFLLKRFAYGPIINVLRERKQKIEAGIKASEASERKLAQAEEEHKRIILKAEEEAVGVVSHADKLAKEQAEIILQSAREKGEQVISLGKKRTDEERLKIEEEFTTHAQEFIKKGITATIRKMKPSDRDDALISEALKELKTIQ